MPSAPLPFWSRSRCALAAFAFVLPALTLGLAGGACAAQDEAAQGAGGSSSGTGDVGSAASVGVGGNDADATVPDAQPDVTPPTYADLCGDGPCAPGPGDGCEGESEARGARNEDEGPIQGATARGCHVVADDDGDPETVCVTVGEGEVDAPCQTGADCGPGTTCVPTEQSGNQTPAGICRPYCCDDVENCGDGSFCAPRPQIEDPDLDVPVCVAVTPCELLEDGSCPVGTTCLVVREDGTTSCAQPGNGGLCEPCPCAAGFVCAIHTGLCEKLCRTDGTGDECGSGFCQGGSSDYPAGIGVCVAGDDDACSDP